MPEDEKVTEQTPDELDEFEAAFAEDEEEETQAKEKEASAKKEEKEGEAEKKAAKKEEKPEEKKEEKPLIQMGAEELKKAAEEFPDIDTSNMSKEELVEAVTKAREAKAEGEKKTETTQERLDRRTKELEAEEKEAGKKKKPEDEGESEEEAKKKAEAEKKTKEEGTEKKKIFTKEDIAERLTFLSNDELPEQMVIGDLEINVKEYAERYPEEFGIIKVAASAIAEKMIDKVMGNLKGVDPETVESGLSEVNVKIAQLSFDNQVARAMDDEGNIKHPDYYQIVYGSGMKDFQGWVKAQPDRVQRLASSLDPKDGELILDMYKEQTAKKKAADFDKKAKAKKKEIDDIHTDTGRGKSSITDRGGTGAASPGGGEAEAEAAFMEG